MGGQLGTGLCAGTTGLGVNREASLVRSTSQESISSHCPKLGLQPAPPRLTEVDALPYCSGHCKAYAPVALVLCLGLPHPAFSRPRLLMGEHKYRSTSLLGFLGLSQGFSQTLGCWCGPIQSSSQGWSFSFPHYR